MSKKNTNFAYNFYTSTMTDDNSLKQKTARGLIWGGFSNGIVQLLGALFGIILLNLLTPEDYGKIAVLLIFSSIAASLQESGFNAALINKKEPTHDEYNAVFWFNIIVSISIYVILWFAAPYIAEFYHEPVLCPLARLLFLGFVFSALGSVQRAYIMGHLLVKQNSITLIVALLVSNIIGVTMAFLGFAFWGLATQALVYVLVTTICNWYASPWRPTLHIDLRPAWKMFSFSSKLIVTNLFNQLNSQVFSFLLGHYYNTKTAGIYSNARKWNDMAVNTIQGMMSGVSQPVLAQVADDDGRYRMVFRKMLRFASFVSFPCMLGLALIAPEFILITVRNKWIESAPILSLLCIYGAFYPITMLYSNMAISRGKSGINMFCTISLCILVWAGLFLLHSYGMYPMIIYFVVINLLWLVVWQWFAWKMIRLSFWDAMKDVLPFFCFAAAVMAITWFATRNIENIYIAIVAKITLAALLYLGITYLSGARIMRESIEYLRKK